MCKYILSIRKDITNMHSKLADLEAAAKDTSARLTKLEDETLLSFGKERKEAELKLREAILALKIRDRKQNLMLFYGMEKDRDKNMAGKVKECIQKLGFTEERSQDILLINAHRLPRRPIPMGDGGEH